MPFTPSYQHLLSTGELSARARRLEQMLTPCRVCPLLCGIDRLNGETARCHTGYLPVVSSYTPHFGEEPPLTGAGGVGNIFFGNCNLRCDYCQNHLISQNHADEEQHEVTIGRLAGMMLELERKGCSAIGLVSPSHVVPQIVLALEQAARQGLDIPLVYNTNAYDSLEVLQLLEGIVDIYLPDLKYSDPEMGMRYSHVPDYVRIARAAVREMRRQVGLDLVMGEDALVKRGLIIRHLVLPNDIAGSRESLRWIRDELGADATLSVMAQYYPEHRGRTMPLLDRKIRESEYERVLAYLEALGMENGWAQQYESAEYYRPEFARRERPFAGPTDNRE
jgi:putative pyruvate formate lyase activating enzyme